MTYSAVARCPDTGMFGVAVSTRNLAVGYQAPFARAGVGAISSQAQSNFAYGFKGLDLLADGLSAEEVVDRITSEDDDRELRQVGLVGPEGNGAAFTGSRCIRYAEHVTKDGVSFQANLMRNPGVPEAMARSWNESVGKPLEDRLLVALVAAEEAGGDLRGRQSAAIKIVAAERGELWEGTVVDLRVDDHADPLDELSRLVITSKAYRAADAAASLHSAGDTQKAMQAWDEFVSILPNLSDGHFWRGVFLATIGKFPEAKLSIRRASQDNPDFEELLRRLPETGVIDESLLIHLL